MITLPSDVPSHLPVLACTEGGRSYGCASKLISNQVSVLKAWRRSSGAQCSFRCCLWGRVVPVKYPLVRWGEGMRCWIRGAETFRWSFLLLDAHCLLAHDTARVGTRLGRRQLHSPSYCVPSTTDGYGRAASTVWGRYEPTSVRCTYIGVRRASEPQKYFEGNI